jgi:hypothetical protein
VCSSTLHTGNTDGVPHAVVLLRQCLGRGLVGPIILEYKHASRELLECVGLELHELLGILLSVGVAKRQILAEWETEHISTDRTLT